MTVRPDGGSMEIQAETRADRKDRAESYEGEPGPEVPGSGACFPPDLVEDSCMRASVCERFELLNRGVSASPVRLRSAFPSPAPPGPASMNYSTETTRRSSPPVQLGGGPPPPARSFDKELVKLDPEERATIRVLVVDDEHSLRESCASLLRSEGFDVEVEGRGERALDRVARQPFDILLVDVMLGEHSGIDVMQTALEAYPRSVVILMTGNPSVEASIRVLQDGAWDYLPKPFSATHLQVLMGRAAHTVMVRREGASAGEGDREDGGLDLTSESPAFSRVLKLAGQVARTDASVFLTGESGSGKEVLATYIHGHSLRRARPLIAVNCAAIPEALVESEMFGHVKGAFTGAVREKEGLLEAANGGTLFLDELTELPLATQAKLLRVLQDGVVRRVGSVETDAVVNVRFIAATNRDPEEAIREGRLREDLHYRLRVVPIRVPPLRERSSDIPKLAEDFLQEFWIQHRTAREDVPRFSPGAIRELQSAPFPGNVRELRNVIEHLVVLAEPGSVLEPGDIPIHGGTGRVGSSDGMPSFDSYLSMEYREARERLLSEFETRYLSHIVEEANGNISEAARRAGVDRTTIYRLMDKHGTSGDELVHGDRPDGT